MVGFPPVYGIPFPPGLAIIEPMIGIDGLREVEASGCGACGVLPVGMEGVYIEPAVGTVPGVGLAVAALPVRNSVCIKLSGSGGSNLGSTGADVEPASLGADSGCEDDTPCMVVIPGISGGG